MREPSRDLSKFREFLASIPLSKHREETKDIKWVEQDLPREILPLASIFRYYWEERRFLAFDDWFEEFWEEINSNPQSRSALEGFKKYHFNRSIEENGWFKRGFRARMYRTWVSLLTQLDFCYIFEYVCAKKGKNLSLICSAELDAKGIDAQVNDIGFQIAKLSERKEARTGITKRKIVSIPYAVFNIEELDKRLKNSRTRKKETYEGMLRAFNKYFEVLRNGFVVFKEAYIERIVENIDDSETLKAVGEKISSELRGRSL